MEAASVLLIPFNWVYINNALSGALANVFAVSLLHPIETARTRLQVQDDRVSNLSFRVAKDIYKAEGWAGLYRGWRSLVLSLTVTNFVYFYCFYGLKLNLQTGDQSVGNDFLFALLSGVVAVLLSNPFWVVNTRLKLQTVKVVGRSQSFYAGIYDCFRRVREEEGWRAFALGLTPSLLLVSNPVINFIIYEMQRRHLTDVMAIYMNTSTLYFMFGGVSKFITTIITYPLQFVQTRSRAGLKIMEDSEKPKNKTESLWHLLRGIECKLTQTVLTSALMFLVFENLRALLHSLSAP